MAPKRAFRFENGQLKFPASGRFPLPQKCTNLPISKTTQTPPPLGATASTSVVSQASTVAYSPAAAGGGRAVSGSPLKVIRVPAGSLSSAAAGTGGTQVWSISSFRLSRHGKVESSLFRFLAPDCLGGPCQRRAF